MDGKGLFTVFVVLLAALGAVAYFAPQTFTTDKREVDAGFSQKKECEKYRDIIEERVAKELTWKGDGGTAVAKVEEIWFSIAQATCLYSITQEVQLSYEKKMRRHYAIYDYFTNDAIFEASDHNNRNALSPFQEKKESLR